MIIDLQTIAITKLFSNFLVMTQRPSAIAVLNILLLDSPYWAGAGFKLKVVGAPLPNFRENY